MYGINLRFVILGLALVVLASGAPQLGNEDPVFKAAQAGNWEEVDKLLKAKLSHFGQNNPEEIFREVKNLRPDNGEQVHGESSYSFHSSSNINGKKSESSGGHRVINDNGKVREYDYEPATTPAVV